MSEGGNEPGLVSYFRVWGPARFSDSAGTPLGRRSLQLKIKEFDLPIIETGIGDPLIDPVAGDDQLRKYARRADEPRRGRGRPRKA
jgi:hypothetical protein